MEETYKEYARLFKALSDPKRLMIVDLLARGELCACVLLENFQITQPTLSHHMKNLCDCNLLHSRKEGKWIHYSLNDDAMEMLRGFLDGIAVAEDDIGCRGNICREDCCK